MRMEFNGSSEIGVQNPNEAVQNLNDEVLNSNFEAKSFNLQGLSFNLGPLRVKRRARYRTVRQQAFTRALISPQFPAVLPNAISLRLPDSFPLWQRIRDGSALDTSRLSSSVYLSAFVGFHRLNT